MSRLHLGELFLFFFERGEANGDGDRALKQHLDRYVIGQDRSKRVLSTAIYHHYQRVALLRKHELERQEMLLQEQSRAFALDAFGGFSLFPLSACSFGGG